MLRLATPLLDAQLLTRDRESGHFRLGSGALALGQAYLAGLDLRTVASDEAHRLMREWGGTVHLCVPDAPHVALHRQGRERDPGADGVADRLPGADVLHGGRRRPCLAWLPEKPSAR
ncbi:hypothetical protein ACU686_04520 [Yinghuangia aomiensis]